MPISRLRLKTQFQRADDDVTSANPHEPIVVAIVEDDRATREGLGLLIDGTPGYVVWRFVPVEDALNSIMQETPRVLLLDIRSQACVVVTDRSA